MVGRRSEALPLKIIYGDIEEKPVPGISYSTKKAIRLNPIPPANYVDYLGSAYYFLGRYEDAIEMHNKVLKRSPNNLMTHLSLTVAYSASGREEEARQQAEKVVELDPAFTLEELAEMMYVKDRTEAERYVANLRKAGLK